MDSSDEEAIRGGGAAVVAADPTRSQVRAGGKALSVLATPLNLRVLQALSDRPMRLAELRKATGLPAQTTLRGHLTNLAEIGVLTKRPTQQMPYAVENTLTPMGRELLDVADQLGAWLGEAPDAPISLESGAAKGAVKALVDGWGSKMMRALAARPLSLTELDSLISDLSYPALERRLSSMRIAGLVEAQQSDGAGTPYGVTDWARRGVAPLAAASHCEQVHMRHESAPLTQIDVEAAFLLATPLARLPSDAAGSCQLEVEASPRVFPRPAGVQVTIERGKVVSCVSHLEPGPPAFAAGPALTWFNAVRDGSIGQLKFGGSRQLAEDLVSGLHSAFGRRA
ncbi:MAG TPA: winged helix-turn-helix transcriptional regulator [Solirubrobacterales bacterium]|nr:winged helix-turn-helix transcriptional regulator [Solirubrobacterales bacterium]